MSGGISGLLDVAEPATLRFGSHQDALDFARHSAENANRLLAAQSLDAVDRYRKGEVAAYVGVRSRRGGHQYYLAFFRIPPESGASWAGNEQSAANIEGRLAVERGRSIGDVEGHEGAVFLGVTELVHGLEGSIPSFVWAECAKERCDFRGQMLTDAASTVNVVVKAGEVISERKVGSFRGDLSACDGAGEAGLVQDGPQVEDCIEKDAGQLLRQWLDELDFMNVIPRIRLFINVVGPWLFVDEVVDDCLEVTDVMLCSIEGQLRTAEFICHDQRRNTASRRTTSRGN